MPISHLSHQEMEEMMVVLLGTLSSDGCGRGLRPPQNTPTGRRSSESKSNDIIIDINMNEIVRAHC